MKQDLLRTSYAPMSKSERAKLQKGLYIIPFFMLFAGGVFYYMLAQADELDFFFWAVTFMGCAFAGIILWILGTILLDLRDNEKKIIQGASQRSQQVNIQSFC